jgi:hypothetical protein
MVETIGARRPVPVPSLFIAVETIGARQSRHLAPVAILLPLILR